MLKLEKRANPSQFWVWASPALALCLTVLIGLMIFSLLGKDPLRGLQMFFWEPIKSGYAWGELCIKAAPLLLIALGLGLCYRANVWNIGAEGQYILGAILASGVALLASQHTGRWIFVAVMLAGVLGGMFWAVITAYLRNSFHANEILVSLMLVYIAEMLLAYLVYGPWKDPAGFNFPQTKSFEAVTKIPRLIEGSRVHLGVVVSLFAAMAMWILMFRTKLGFTLQVGGESEAAARYAGFRASKSVWIGLLMSGGIAGLAGGIEVAGPIGQLTPHVPAGYGFAAIIVAFVGRLHPVGIIFSAILMSMFYIGGELAQTRMGLPKSVTGVFQGLLLFCLLACDALIYFSVRRSGRFVVTGSQKRPTTES